MTNTETHATPGTPAGRGRRMGVVHILLATLLWALPALAIEYLTEYLDLWTQNFIRIASAAAFLWAVCLVRSPREVLAGLPRLVLRILPAFLALFAYQVLYVRALYMQSVLPGLAFMLLKASVFFTVVFSCILFADERAAVRDRRFQVGALFSIAGLAGFVLVGLGSQAGDTAGPGLIWGVLVLLGSSIFWALYTVLIKLLVRRGSPLVAYTYVCTLMTLAFGALSFARGDPAELIPRSAAGVRVLVIAIGSGVLCVGAAHVAYYYAIRSLGATICGIVLLAGTFLTPLLSVIIFGEPLSIWAVLSGVILIIGSACALQARQGPPPDEP
ncbi:MAG: DMT family transporter [Planctomycetota bacterium]